ncbi:MAG: hypothetical protein M3323_08495 [Actinomycetota bacterium]|nr:hypothetical protein [Actinomycetota bacterium]
MRQNRRSPSAVLVAGAVAAGVFAGPPRVPASARPGGEPVPPATALDLPRSVETFLAEAQQQFDTANLMLAQFVRPRHKGYDWTVLAFKQNASARTNLSISFARTTVEGTQTQTSTFGWTLPKGALRMDRDLKPSSLSTGRGMGSNGRISMRLSGESQFVRARDPANCSGSVSYRAGWFRGTFRFDARDEYFGKIRFPRTRVVLYRANNLRCEGQPGQAPCPDHLSFSAIDADTGVGVGAFKTDEGKVDQSVLVVGSSGKARTAHRISVTVATPAAFEASDDLTTASVDGDVAAPLLSGDLDYLAPPPAAPGADDCGGYQSTSGIATGDYTAHFDSIGPVTPASAGITATLRREDP